VVKDGGDDPDITSGLKVFAQVRFIEDEGIRILAGEGIGTVTMPGLKVEVGKPAINPVPMKMIIKEVREVLNFQEGVEILLSVPGGKDIAEKTYNPKLGIMGGISILGTSGIVTPMSEEAWKDSIAVELSVAVARGYKDIVFTFGNYGENFTKNQLAIDEERIIKISNFVGYMLDRAVEYGVENVLLVGHIGKLVKVAAGIFYTHSRTADARMEILTSYAALEGAPKDVLKDIYECRTTDGAAAIIKDKGLTAVFQRITMNSSKRCRQYTFNKVKVGTVLFNEDNSLLWIDNNGREIISRIEGRKNNE
jgi:cobalt-precorrin-5B (C1)-methyltransferase